MSFVPAFEASLKRDVASAPRIVNLRGAACSSRVSPAIDVTRNCQRMLPSAAVPLGVAVSVAPGGKTPSTPEIVHSVTRP